MAIGVLLSSHRSKGNVWGKKSLLVLTISLWSKFKVEAATSSGAHHWAWLWLPLFLHPGWVCSVLIYFLFCFLMVFTISFQSALIHRVHRSSWRNTPGQPVLSCYGVSFCGCHPCVPKPRVSRRSVYAGAAVTVSGCHIPLGTCSRDQTAMKSRRARRRPRWGHRRAALRSVSIRRAATVASGGMRRLTTQPSCAGSSPPRSSGPSRRRSAWARWQCTCTGPPEPALAHTQTGPVRSRRCKSHARCSNRTPPSLPCAGTEEGTG